MELRERNGSPVGFRRWIFLWFSSSVSHYYSSCLIGSQNKYLEQHTCIFMPQSLTFKDVEYELVWFCPSSCPLHLCACETQDFLRVVRQDKLFFPSSTPPASPLPPRPSETIWSGSTLPSKAVPFMVLQGKG